MKNNLKTAALHNLGCKVNGYELDIMTQKLKEDGYTIVPFEEKADLYVINTCTVTNIADRKSRQMLHRAKSLNPDSIVVAVGCYVETDVKRIEEDPAIDFAIGNKNKGRIAEVLHEYLQERQGNLPDQPNEEQEQSKIFRQEPDAQVMPTHLDSPGHTRAFLKIQDGCNMFCSYCIIPYARGRIQSRDMDEIVEEIISLAENGVQEVVLTGIHISSYGKEKGKDPEEELIRLLTRVQMIKGITRIRLGSLEPRIITEHFAAAISGLSKVCPHFHLSLQSGCDSTLKRMNRHYTAAEYAEGVRLLRKYYDRPAITTDVIVGFAGETQEEFDESVRFCREIGFYEIHVFRYSVRKGTVAARMPDQLTNAVKEERSDVLLQVTQQQAQSYRKSFIGEEEEILIEEKKEVGGRLCYVGHTKRYVEGVVPADEVDTPENGLIRGIFEAVEEGTPYLRLKPIVK